MTLPDYIKKHYCGIQARFAAAIGVKAPQVTQWNNRGCIVEDEWLYSPVDGDYIERDGITYKRIRDLSVGGVAGVER